MSQSLILESLILASPLYPTKNDSRQLEWPKPVFNQHECPPTSMWTLCSANSYILNIFFKCVTLNKGYNSHADYTIVSHPFLLVFFLQWRRRPTDLVKFQASPGETIWDKHWSADNIFHHFQVSKLHRLCYQLLKTMCYRHVGTSGNNSNTKHSYQYPWAE